ncbi:expressed unknown protein [Seminavis robusta]|uniref:Uncharacterized protein n=1 Tax=Seminavis robusta TaxID=568900 RepID=A0A9N8DFJ7_9STRA|nr:expressed unknown protein [Seminavis robusta]|eukprot:Sro101_g051460.1 n/a (320) ;mRNA; r:17618-18691
MNQEGVSIGSCSQVAGERVHVAASSYLEVENHLRKKARLGTQHVEAPMQHQQAHPSTNDTLSSSCSIPTETVVAANLSNLSTSSLSIPTTSSGSTMAASEQKPINNAKSGRWSLDEKLLFLYGLSVFGKGRWKKISAYVPDRSLVQIKSHAQKVLKRLDAGENVFLRLEENRERLKSLVEEANLRIDRKEAKANLLSPNKKKRKRASTRKPSEPYSALITEAAPWDQPHESWRKPNSTQCSTASSSPVPSLLSASEDPPCVSLQPPEQNDTTMERRSSASSCTSATTGQAAPRNVPVAGTGAVIAAVAALCQLSASSDC